MDSFSQIETEIGEAIEKRKKIILDALDGRRQRFIAEKTGVDETRISRWINFNGTLEPEELRKINTLLGTNF